MKPMAKAKLSTHKGVVQDIFDGCHVTIFATSRSEISKGIVTDKVRMIYLVVQLFINHNIESGPHNYPELHNIKV